MAYKMLRRFLIHFFWSSVRLKFFPLSSRSRLYLEIMTPMKRLSRKKLPKMMIKVKKRPDGMLYISLLAI